MRVCVCVWGGGLGGYSGCQDVYVLLLYLLYKTFSRKIDMSPCLHGLGLFTSCSAAVHEYQVASGTDLFTSL